MRRMLFLFILLFFSMAFADKGMIIIGPKDVSLTETGQNAIVAWNGSLEVLILSTAVKSSAQTLVLEVLPLPSKPEVIQGNYTSFKKLVEIYNKKAKSIRESRKSLTSSKEFIGVEIVLHKKIGAHDVTVVKINDLNNFLSWVENYTKAKGFNVKLPSNFKATVKDYLNRNLSFFVFDFINASDEDRSVAPLVYKFKTNFLYYPLKITAFSDAGGSFSTINLFLITNGIINKDAISNINLWPRSGFDYKIMLTKKELREISFDIASLFPSAYVMNVYYFGPLKKLNEDLMITNKDVYVPTFFDKISDFFSYLPVTSFISNLVKTESSSLGFAVVLRIFLISFFSGVASAIYILSKLFVKVSSKLKKHGINYLLSSVLVLLLVFSKSVVITTFVFGILTILGVSMLLFVGMVTIKKVSNF